MLMEALVELDWLDLVRLKNAVIQDGITELCLMHMDDLGKIGWKLGEIKVCTSYIYSQPHNWPITIDYVPVDSENCEPIYKSFKQGWVLLVVQITTLCLSPLKILSSSLKNTWRFLLCILESALMFMTSSSNNTYHYVA